VARDNDVKVRFGLVTQIGAAARLMMNVEAGSQKSLDEFARRNSGQLGHKPQAFSTARIIA